MIEKKFLKTKKINTDTKKFLKIKKKFLIKTNYLLQVRLMDIFKTDFLKEEWEKFQ